MARVRLESGAPDLNCQFSKNDIRTIARWLAKRYTRSAFPTAFNKRIPDAINKKIRKVLAAKGKDITGIFVTFFGSESELPDNEPYEISIRIIVPTAAAVDKEREMQAIGALSEISMLLGKCAGIELLDISVESESEFSLEDWDLSRVWDFDYLSQEDEEEIGLQ